jgi:hypothetical protein
MMVNFKMRGYLFTAIVLVTFLTVGMPTSSIARQISFAPNRTRAIESRIEIGGAIHNLPNYQTPESCEDVEIKYTDVTDNAPTLPTRSNNLTSPKSKDNAPSSRCRYLLQVPRSYAGKQISISISPVDRPDATQSVVFVVPFKTASNRAIVGPTFEF